MPGQHKILAAIVLAAGLLLAGTAWASSEAVETRHLVVRDAVGTLSPVELQGFAERAQELLERILVFWSVDDGVERFGKIRVVLDGAPRGGCTSVFYWDRQGGGVVRAVRVFGCVDAPQTLAHKLTAALLPQKDKLIRNMLGLIAEQELGNRRSFPLCGLAADDWVAALAQTNSLLALKDLGPDHESWGMRDVGNGRVMVHDRPRQHAAYVETGSFGAYLYRTYGLDRLKRLQRLSQGQSRPMQEAFGRSLQELEADWLNALKASAAARPEAQAQAARLLRDNPRTACTVAQQLGDASGRP